MLKSVDMYSRNSSARYIHPVEKMLFCIVSIVIVSNCENVKLIFINSIVIIFLHIYFKTPKRLVLKYVFGIVGFSFLSAVVYSFELGIGILIIILFRTLFCSLMLTLLIFTTPMDDIIGTIKGVSFLRDTAEIMEMMFRFLFVLEDELMIINKSMRSRCGFLGIKAKIEDTGRLSAVLFINTLKRYREVKDALNTRCYVGRSSSLRKFSFSPKRLAFIVLYLSILTFLSF
ncbi:MAG: cobalt ABC transporter permease [Caloramator sp.]|uniref:Cobalt/nickel transport system permease protein n=1 Tax=Caloramator proteoclasticus DSM 10124 TaxID=1121262 RepID=A0A1M4S8S9_9CLOT|nr:MULTISPECIES: energy-coupling factor transporter transmembrane component T [Caloramator]GIW48646.1 MAG: cobalt ABC transporter permease [Caloramator sp.]SHE28457.1 cobalt/nickel transport system permease protein [Caloramator proteoclasticus DSM 10124]